jgi:alkanesulfonate monooxygenase SsuD/methylene tetrahydromethanopterin reductase-like flavin-dependent oxidoreductase (luciferase family)
MLFQAKGPVDFDGEHYQLHQAPFSPACVQKPHPPIFVGGGGEKRTLRTAARYADAINVMGALDQVKHKIEVLERHCADAGRDPGEIVKSTFGPVLLVDDAERAKTLRERLAPMGGTTPERAAETMAIGDAAHVRGVIERFAEAGISYMIMMSRPPYNFDLYRRISDEIVAPFA